MKCKNCQNKDDKIEKNNSNCDSKKKKNIILLFIIVLISLCLVYTVGSFLAGILEFNILNSKYGAEIIVEAIMAIMGLIIVINNHNTYIFTQKKEKFRKAIILGLPIILFTLSIFITSISDIKHFSISNALNLLMYCTLIGFFEEFIFRGWILNEFLENYGDNRKQVITSIILSSIIFGIVHISNVSNSQDLLSTLTQIINATGVGILLSCIYFRTKNIWSIIFLHAFYDFFIMLPNAGLIRDCIEQITTNAVLIYNIYSTSLLFLIWLISALIIFRKSKTNMLIDKDYKITDDELKKDKQNFIILNVCLLSLFILILMPIDESKIKGLDEYKVCYHYEKKDLDFFTTSIPNYSKFKIEYDNYKIELSDENAKSEIGLKINDNIIYFEDMYIYDYQLIDYQNNFAIMLYDDYNQKLYYQIIDKSTLSTDKTYLNKIRKSFKEYNVPTIEYIGYLTTEDAKYPLLISNLKEQFIIDEEQNLYLVR